MLELNLLIGMIFLSILLSVKRDFFYDQQKINHLKILNVVVEILELNQKQKFLFSEIHTLKSYLEIIQN